MTTRAASAALVILVLLGACAPPIDPPVRPSLAGSEGTDAGVLVMAHGGSPEWNQSVAGAVAPIAAELPTVVAYGMADPVTLARGLDSLRALGVDRVAVVRLFVSGRSFLEQTEYFLGLVAQRPAHLLLMGRDPSVAEPIDHGMRVVTHSDGLMTSAEARRILLARAVAVSVDRGRESVLLIAHGMGDDDEDAQVLDALGQVTRELEGSGFRAAHAATLREDWADKREAAEIDIRAFVQDETARGRTVIVVPMRLSGFGPYAEVLAGLEYVAADGLLPHPEVGVWIRGKASELLRSGDTITRSTTSKR